MPSVMATSNFACAVTVLKSHMVGIIHGQFWAEKDAEYTGFYAFETTCETFSCVYINAKDEAAPAYFEANKVKILAP